jgi:hypothetical protein
MEKLPVELQVRFLNLPERHVHRFTGRGFKNKRSIGEARQFPFESSNGLGWRPPSDPDRLADNPFEIAGFGEPALHSRGTDFQGIALFSGDGIFIVEELSEAFGDKLAVRVGDATGFIDIYAKQASFASAPEFNLYEIDAGTGNGALPQFGEAVGESFTGNAGHWKPNKTTGTRFSPVFTNKKVGCAPTFTFSNYSY